MPADPLYRRIAEDLRDKIEAGQIPHGSQLPTEIELSDQYRASRNTVRDAIRSLITRGLVETRPGRGTFVVAKLDPFITTLDWQSGFSGGEGSAYYESEVQAERRKASVSVPRIEIQPNTVAPELQLADGISVVSRHQQRMIDGTPWSLQTTFYSMRLVESGAVRLFQAEDIPTGTVQYLKETLGIKQVGWRDRIMVRAPDAIEASFFQLADDGRTPVFEIRRTAFEESGKPFRLTVTTYPADRNRFVINVGQVPSEGPAAEDSPAQQDDS
jgi:GntR family transcriptional regulator